MGSGYQDLGTFRGILYFQDINLDPLCRFEYLCLYLFVFCQDGICLSQVDAVVPSHISLNDTGHYILFFCIIFIKDHFPLFFPDFLKDHIFCVLCGDTPELFGFDLYIYDVPQVILGIHHLCIRQADLCHRILNLVYYCFLCKHSEIAGVRINIDFYIIRFSKMILTGLDQRLFNSL